MRRKNPKSNNNAKIWGYDVAISTLVEKIQW